MIQRNRPQPARGSIPGKRLRKIRQETIRLAREPKLNFFELAGLIADLHGADPAEITDLPQEARMSRRRLYYLLDVGRLIRKCPITKAEAERVGWTKLQVIAQHTAQRDDLDQSEVRSFLETAAVSRVRALAAALKGGDPRSTRAAVFHLTKGERDQLEDALTAFGAKPGRTGLIDKEAAIMELTKAAMAARARANT